MKVGVVHFAVSDIHRALDFYTYGVKSLHLTITEMSVWLVRG